MVCRRASTMEERAHKEKPKIISVKLPFSGIHERNSSSHIHDTFPLHLKQLLVVISIRLKQREKQGEKKKRNVFRSSPQVLRQSRNVVLEQFLRLLPDTGVGSVLELQETWEQGLAEHLRALTREQRRQMINADNAQGQFRVTQWEIDWHSGLVKGRRDVVDRHGVVGVCPEPHISQNIQKKIPGDKW